MSNRYTLVVALATALSLFSVTSARGENRQVVQIEGERALASEAFAWLSKNLPNTSVSGIRAKSGWVYFYGHTAGEDGDDNRWMTKRRGAWETFRSVQCLYSPESVRGKFGTPIATARWLLRWPEPRTCAELWQTRNGIYAAHGRPFKDPEVRAYFTSQWWYKPDPSYTDARLSADDKREATRLLALEKAKGCP